MDNLTVFKFEENNVEIITLNNEPLFNARNVGECLGMGINAVNNHIVNMSAKQVVKLTNNLVSSNTILNGIRTLNNAGENFLTEKGVYKLILKSRKPSAEKFQDWVCDEVLPVIRKHGAYMSPKTIDELTDNPDLLLSLITKLKKEKEAKEEAIRTKAMISSKREATCMVNTAIAYKKVGQLEEKVNISRLLQKELQYWQAIQMLMYLDLL